MLRELHISNLAVISDVRIELHPSLNCFTGATGAGKSLVIGALELLLGLRSPAEMIRPGAEEGRVAGVFELHDPAMLKALSLAADTDLSADGNELLLTRRLYASGRSSVSLNGNPITLSMLKNVAELLVDVHGQHDHQFLLRPANQLDVLDDFGDLTALRAEYHSVYQQLTEAHHRMDVLSSGKQLRQQQLELYCFQAEEIDNAQLDPREYQELHARTSMLRNPEKLKKDAAQSHQALYESDNSAIDRLRMITGVLGELALLDERLTPIAQTVKTATIELEEASRDLSHYMDRLDVDPAELAEAEDRLNTIHRVLAKYGDPIETTIAYRQEIAAKIAELEKNTTDFGGLQKLIDPLLKELRALGVKLTESRTGTAGKLGPLIEQQLAELGMEKARFTVALTPAAATMTGIDLPAATSGFDQVEFMIQTNPGQLAQPLRKIASGGELSRIMLALKGILAAADRVSVLVFDEIDSNVGGRLGSVIGKKLRELGTHHQVLCITHLPQIACFADRHLTVHKAVIGNLTQTTVREMHGADRLQELAEMIGGQHITPTTLAQVTELLAAARASSSITDPKPIIVGKKKGKVL